MNFDNSLRLCRYSSHLVCGKIYCDYGDEDEGCRPEAVINIKKAARNKKHHPLVLFLRKSKIYKTCDDNEYEKRK